MVLGTPPRCAAERGRGWSRSLDAGDGDAEPIPDLPRLVGAARRVAADHLPLTEAGDCPAADRNSGAAALATPSYTILRCVRVGGGRGEEAELGLHGGVGDR